MKPDKKTCQNCGKEIDRGKYCSSACKQQAFRKRNKPVTEKRNVTPKSVTHVDENVTESQNVTVDGFRAQLTKTDKTFYDRALRDFKEPYYYFGVIDPPRKQKCGYCGKPYQTSLRLNRYCSYDHYHLSIMGIL